MALAEGSRTKVAVTGGEGAKGQRPTIHMYHYRVLYRLSTSRGWNPNRTTPWQAGVACTSGIARSVVHRASRPAARRSCLLGSPHLNLKLSSVVFDRSWKSIPVQMG